MPGRPADGALRPGARRRPGDRPRSPRSTRPSWPGASRSSGCGRSPRSWPSSTARRCPRRRRSPRCPAAGCCPGAVGSGSTRSTSGTCTGWPTRATPPRSSAAGGHHLLLSGPKGSGKTSLAERIPGILPDLTREEAVELTALHSLAGPSSRATSMISRPPYAAPHHDASKAALVGGGQRPRPTRRDQPGALRRALPRRVPAVPHRRDRRAARADGERRHHHRPRRRARRPARPRASSCSRRNPCPCGNYHPHASTSRCTCREQERKNYQSRVRGPITDRIDITRHLQPLTARRPRPVLPSRDHRRGAHPGRGGAAAPAGALRRRRLAAQRPGPRRGAPRPLAPDPARPSSTSTTSCSAVG